MARLRPPLSQSDGTSVLCKPDSPGPVQQSVTTEPVAVSQSKPPASGSPSFCLACPCAVSFWYPFSPASDILLHLRALQTPGVHLTEKDQERAPRDSLATILTANNSSRLVFCCIETIT